MKKLFFVLPMLLLMLVSTALGALDISWQCPISGTSATATVRDYATYTDDPPFTQCTMSGNNLTIEFYVTGTAADWQGSKEFTETNMSATLYFKQGSSTILTLPLDSHITNASATSSDLIRFTDFGKLNTVNGGKPYWYGNLTEGGYYWHVTFTNTTDASITGNTLLSSEKGASASNPVHMTIDKRGSAAAKAYAAYQSGEPGTEEFASVFATTTVPNGSTNTSALLLLVIAVGAWLLLRKK